MEETGTRDPTAWGTTRTLFAPWKSQADCAGTLVAAMKRFVSDIEDRGLLPNAGTMAVASLG